MGNGKKGTNNGRQRNAESRRRAHQFERKGARLETQGKGKKRGERQRSGEKNGHAGLEWGGRRAQMPKNLPSKRALTQKRKVLGAER